MINCFQIFFFWSLKNLLFLTDTFEIVLKIKFILYCLSNKHISEIFLRMVLQCLCMYACVFVLPFDASFLFLVFL